MKSFYRYINALSLDTSIGGMICLMAFAKILNVNVGVPSLAILGNTIWLIYTFDHLIDAQRLQKRATSFRHLLHWRYRKSIKMVFAFIVLLNIGLLFLIPLETALWGALLCILVVFYFLVIFRKLIRVAWAKEMSSSIIYSLGIFLPILSVAEGLDFIKVLPLIMSFWCVVALNLMVFAVCERRTDLSNSFESVVTKMGLKKVYEVSFILICAFLFLSIVAIITGIFLFPMSILAIMTLILILILLLKEEYMPDDLTHRYIGDGIFYLPILLML